MVKNFKHKGLKQFFIKDDKRLLNKQMLPRIKRILDRLDLVELVEDMDIPGWHFHQLKGKSKGTYSVRVTGNWRLTFRFEKNNAIDIDLEDYH